MATIAFLGTGLLGGAFAQAVLAGAIAFSPRSLNSASRRQQRLQKPFVARRECI